VVFASKDKLAMMYFLGKFEKEKRFLSPVKAQHKSFI